MQRIQSDERGSGRRERIDDGAEVGEIPAAPVARGSRAVKAQSEAGATPVDTLRTLGAHDEAGFGQHGELRLLYAQNPHPVIAQPQRGQGQPLRDAVSIVTRMIVGVFPRRQFGEPVPVMFEKLATFPFDFQASPNRHAEHRFRNPELDGSGVHSNHDHGIDDAGLGGRAFRVPCMLDVRVGGSGQAENRPSSKSRVTSSRA